MLTASARSGRVIGNLPSRSPDSNDIILFLPFPSLDATRFALLSSAAERRRARKNRRPSTRNDVHCLLCDEDDGGGAQNGRMSDSYRRSARIRLPHIRVPINQETKGRLRYRHVTLE